MASLDENIAKIGSYTDPTVQSQRAAGQALLTNQNAATQDFLNRYTGAINGQETMSAMAKRLGEEQGLPQLRANATAINTTLRNIPTVQLSAARGNEITQNQLDRMVSNQQQKVAPLAEEATRQQQAAEGLVNEQMGYAQADQQKALLPYQMESSLLTDRLARETTMFTTQNQNELNALLTKISTGSQITQEEANRAQELSIAEKNFELEKQRLNSTQKTDSNPYMSVGENSRIFNTTTGQFVGGGSTGGTKATTTSYYTTKPTTSGPTYYGSGSNTMTGAGWK